MQEDNVIRDPKGRWKGSGNPSGVSKAHEALREMQRANEAILTANLAALVPGAVKLHKHLLKQGRSLTTKEMLQLLDLTYRYGIGAQKQLLMTPPREADAHDLGNLSADELEAMDRMIQDAKKAITDE